MLWTSRATPQTPLSLPTLRDRADFPSSIVVASSLGPSPTASAPPRLRGNLPRSRPREIPTQAPKPEVISLPHETARRPRIWISAYSSISTECECSRPVAPDENVHRHRSHEGSPAGRRNARHRPNTAPPHRDPSRSPQRTSYGTAPRT